MLYRLSVTLFLSFFVTLARAETILPPVPSADSLGRLRVEESVTPETTDIFGETIDLNSGALAFHQTDVSIPGNFPIDVAIRRAWQGAGVGYTSTLEFENWGLDIPYIHTTMLQAFNIPSLYSGAWGTGSECSGELNPEVFSDSGNVLSDGSIPSFAYWEFWNGDTLNIPGVTNEKLLQTSDATYPRKTKSNWRVSCFRRADNKGEGFLAESPSGLRYRFDKLRRISATSLWKGPGGKPTRRYHAFMLVSRIDDRFGNWVQYNYSGSGTNQKLDSITASDGRIIALTYEQASIGYRIKTVSANDKTWTYNYENKGLNNQPVLASVTRPDQKLWSFDLGQLELPPTPEFGYSWDGSGVPGGCDGYQTRASTTGTITHPNGLIGSFSLHQTVHGRTEVEKRLHRDTKSGRSSHYKPKCFSTMSLTAKTLSGPGIASLSWQYSYSENKGAFIGEAKPTVSGLSIPGYDNGDLKTTTVVAPDGSKSRHIFSRRWDYTEGKEIATELYDADGSSLLSRIEYQFDRGGYSGGGIEHYLENNDPHAYYVNLVRRQHKTFSAGVQVDNYTTEYSNHSDYGLPELIKGYNSFSNAVRWAKMSYQHDTTQWLLNLPIKAELSDNGSSYTTVSETDYYPSATFGCTSCGDNLQPHYQKQFGSTIKTFESYHGDGNVDRVSFGFGNRWQQFGDFYRGKARGITLPGRYAGDANISARLEINDDGTVNSVTDFNSHQTRYDYDSLGRLTLVDPADMVWNNTSITYSDVSSADTSIASAGLVSGQYKQTTARGNYEKTVYFDALLRPVLVRERDSTDATLDRYTRTAFNAYGKPTFQAKASTSAGETIGYSTSYDGLQRVLRVTDTADNSYSETSYLAGNKLKVRNPRAYETTTAFLAYGAPAYEQPTQIDAPESVKTTLAYNLFGNITSISQGGFTENRLYDAHQFLCKRIRPETGQTLFNSNSVGDLNWLAEGVSGSTASCETSTSSTNKVAFSYDNHGALYTEDYVDANTPDKSYKRDKQGNLVELTVGQYNSYDNRWTYAYNSAHLLDRETASVDGYLLSMGYGYNANGQLDTLTYPDSLNVNFAPNAFGQATKAGSFASNVRYHANGLLASFTYGNGVQYSVSQTSQGWPEQFTTSKTAALSQFKYSYDDVGNINEITDYVSSTRSKSFGYDGLDRLTSATGSWGNGSFGYDSTGNLTSRTLGTQALTLAYNSSTNRLDTVSGSVNASYGYDDRGNVTQNGRNTLGYNAANQLTEVGGGNDADFYYDGHGRRIKDLINGLSTYSLYSQSGQLLYKYVAETNNKSAYVYLGNELIAKREQSMSVTRITLPPTGTGGSVDSDGRIWLSWPSSTSATLYRIQVADNASFTNARTVYEGGATDAWLSGLGDGSWYIRIQACNAYGCSDWTVGSEAIVVKLKLVPIGLGDLLFFVPIPD